MSGLDTRLLMCRLPARSPAELLPLLWAHAENLAEVPEIQLTIGVTGGAVFSGAIVDCAAKSSSLHLEDAERGSVFIHLHSVQWLSLRSLPQDLLIALSDGAITPLDFEQPLNQLELMRRVRQLAGNYQSQGKAPLEVTIEDRIDLTKAGERRAVQGTLLWLEKLLDEWRRDPKTFEVINDGLAGFRLGSTDYAYQEGTVFIPVPEELPVFDDFKDSVEALF